MRYAHGGPDTHRCHQCMLPSLSRVCVLGGWGQVQYQRCVFTTVTVGAAYVWGSFGHGMTAKEKERNTCCCCVPLPFPPASQTLTAAQCFEAIEGRLGKKKVAKAPEPQSLWGKITGNGGDAGASAGTGGSSGPGIQVPAAVPTAAATTAAVTPVAPVAPVAPIAPVASSRPTTAAP
jgi:hypothetical protein